LVRIAKVRQLILSPARKLSLHSIFRARYFRSTDASLSTISSPCVFCVHREIHQLREMKMKKWFALAILGSIPAITLAQAPASAPSTNSTESTVVPQSSSPSTTTTHSRHHRRHSRTGQRRHHRRAKATPQ